MRSSTRPAREAAEPGADQPPSGEYVLTTRAGTPATTHRSGTAPRTTEPAAITTLRPMHAPGSTTAPAPSQLPEPIRTAALRRQLPAYRDIRVGVPVVLIGDVDVRSGEDVIPDDERMVRHDMTAPADHAPVPDQEHRGRAEILAGHHPGRQSDERADEGIRSDRDRALPEHRSEREGHDRSGAERGEPPASAYPPSPSRRAAPPPSPSAPLASSVLASSVPRRFSARRFRRPSQGTLADRGGQLAAGAVDLPAPGVPHRDRDAVGLQAADELALRGRPRRRPL